MDIYLNFYSYLFKVCMEIKLEVNAGEHDSEHFLRKWQMGSCYGPPDGLEKQPLFFYNSTDIYIDRCCLLPGNYTLKCKNLKGQYGWGNSSIEIFGQRYCDDFVGFEAMRRVFISGIVKKLRYNLIQKLKT